MSQMKESVYTYHQGWGVWIMDKSGMCLGLLDSDYMGEDAYFEEYLNEIQKDYEIIKHFESEEEYKKYINELI